MNARTRLVCLVWCCFAYATTAVAQGPFEGIWFGGFRAPDGWVFVQARFGGDGDTLAGRMDLPENGEDAILLHNVTGSDRHISFELPGVYGDLEFDGELETPDRISGSVRQGRVDTRFELLRMRALAAETLSGLAGDFQGDETDDVVLVYPRPGGLAYVDYRTRRLGQLYALAPDRFVSGDTLLAGYPVDLEVSFVRGHDGRATELTWKQKGETVRRLVRREFYAVEDHQVRSADGTVLGGSLLVPSSRSASPAIVLIPGSGKVTRDNLMPYADIFARNGVAVAIHDKRGTGRSGGESARAGIYELADDALAWVELVRTHPRIDAKNVGVLGASLGAWVAPLVATRSPDVRFVVVEAASSTTPAEHERSRVRNQMAADRQPQRAIAQAVAYMDRKFEVGRTGAGWEALEREAERGVRDGWIHYVNRPTSLESLRWNWQHLLSYDPGPALERLRVPVLALYGEKDTIVEPGFNMKRMEKALRDAGNTAVTIKVFPRANHHFFAALSGGPGEVPKLKGFVEGYLQSRVDWVLARVAESRAGVPVESRPSARAGAAPGA